MKKSFNIWKEIRKAAGLTQTEMGERIGRAASNVSRFEKGETHAKKTEAAYRDILKNLKGKQGEQLKYKVERQDLKEELKGLKAETVRRIRALQERSKETGEGLGPAGEYFVNKIGLKAFSVTRKTNEEIERDISKIRKFLEAKTSTPEGIEDWKQKLKEKSDELTGLNKALQEIEEEEIEADAEEEVQRINAAAIYKKTLTKNAFAFFWDVYNTIRRSESYALAKYRRMSSEQLQEEITKAINKVIDVGAEPSVEVIIAAMLGVTLQEAEEALGISRSFGNSMSFK